MTVIIPSVSAVARYFPEKPREMLMTGQLNLIY